LQNSVPAQVDKHTSPSRDRNQGLAQLAGLQSEEPELVARDD